MRILITGSQGQVGQKLTQQLIGQAEVLSVDKSELDITDQQAVIHTVTQFEPHVIINAAAYTAVDKAEEQVELSNSINRDGAKYLAIAAQSVNAALLHISTDYVFAGDKVEPYKEGETPCPQGAYGQSKLAGEKAVMSHCSKHIILRTAWVFAEHGNNFVKTMLRLAKERDTLNVVNDQFGGPTYAGDIATTLITMAKRIYQDDDVPYGVYHFAGAPYVSWYEFAQCIFHQAYQQGVISKQPQVNAISTSQYPTPAKRPNNSTLCTSKIELTLGLKASDWQAALTQLNQYE